MDRPIYLTLFVIVSMAFSSCQDNQPECSEHLILGYNLSGAQQRNFDPPINLTIVAPTFGALVDSMKIDIDEDGLDDIKFVISYYRAIEWTDCDKILDSLLVSDIQTYAFPLHNNISILKKSFLKGDTISNINDISFAFDVHSSSYHDCIGGTGGGAFYFKTGYMGIKIFEKFYWLKVSATPYTVDIHEWASNCR